MDLLLTKGFGKDMAKRVGEAKVALVIGEKTGLIQPEARAPKMHFLKTWTEFFDPIAAGKKRFELRKNDRDFRVGDLLVLARYDRLKKQILPGYVCVEVTYMLEGFPGLKTGYCILGWLNNAPVTEPAKAFYMFQITNHIYSK